MRSNIGPKTQRLLQRKVMVMFASFNAVEMESIAALESRSGQALRRGLWLDCGVSIFAIFAIFAIFLRRLPSFAKDSLLFDFFTLKIE
jgi:hypothetical protein